MGHGVEHTASAGSKLSFVQTLEKAPRNTAILGSVAATLVFSGIIWAVMMGRGFKNSV